MNPVTNESQIEILDKVRAIVLGNNNRLEQNYWHSDEAWEERSAEAEVADCNTAHCLAGWLQVLSNDPKMRKLSPAVAGARIAPVAVKMFYKSDLTVFQWFEHRKYVEELSVTSISNEPEQRTPVELACPTTS